MCVVPVPKLTGFPSNDVALIGTNIVVGLAYCISGPPPTTSPIAPGTMWVPLSSPSLSVTYLAADMNSTTGCSTYYTVQYAVHFGCRLVC